MPHILYTPSQRDTPLIASKFNYPTAWGDISTILKDIIVRFSIGKNKALEFGVEFGHSISAIANYFDAVTGVDTFEGDMHSGLKENHFALTSEILEDFKNIKLIKSSYQDFIQNNNETYDLIHIDIIHTYEDTFKCGDWALNHCNVCIFHDTVSFNTVYNACCDLAKKHNAKFYNYPDSNGLGIIVK